MHHNPPKQLAFAESRGEQGSRAQRPQGNPATEAGADRLLRPWGWVFALFWGALTLVVFTPRLAGDDWASIWVGGILASQGDWEEVYSISEKDFSKTASSEWAALRREHTSAPYVHPFVHNPAIGVVAGALARVISFDVSLGLLTAFSGFCVIVLIAAAYYLWVRRTVPLPVLIAGAVMVTVSQPLIVSLELGQTTPLIITGCAVAMAVAPRRPIVAGGLLAAAAFIKLSPAAVIVGLLLVPKYRRAGISAAIMVVAAAAVTLAFWWYPVTLWVHNLKQSGVGYLVTPINASLSSLLYAAEREREVVAIVHGMPRAPVVFFMVVVVAATLAFFAYAWRRQGSFPLPNFLALTLVGPMAVVQLLWLHYSLALVLPLVGIAVAAAYRRHLPLAATFAASWVGLCIPFEFHRSIEPNPVASTHLAVWVLCLFVCAAMGDPLARQRERAGTAAAPPSVS